MFLKNARRMLRALVATPRPLKTIKVRKVEFNLWKHRDPSSGEDYLVITTSRVNRDKHGKASRRQGWYPRDLGDLLEAIHNTALVLADCQAVNAIDRDRAFLVAEMLDLLPAVYSLYPNPEERAAVLQEMHELRTLFPSGEEVLKVLRLLKARRKEGTTKGAQ